MFSLPSGCKIRPATAKDIWTIRKLVLLARLDFNQLRWQQFWVVEKEGKTIACGQLRNFEDGQELGSLVVAKNLQNQGMGSYLTQYLITQATKTLYLECLGSKLVEFYSRLGFVSVSWQELPPSLQRKFSISAWAKNWFHLPVTFMKYQ